MANCFLAISPARLEKKFALWLGRIRSMLAEAEAVVKGQLGEQKLWSGRQRNGKRTCKSMEQDENHTSDPCSSWETNPMGNLK